MNGCDTGAARCWRAAPCSRGGCARVRATRGGGAGPRGAQAGRAVHGAGAGAGQTCKTGPSTTTSWRTSTRAHRREDGERPSALRQDYYQKFASTWRPAPPPTRSTSRAGWPEYAQGRPRVPRRPRRAGQAEHALAQRSRPTTCRHASLEQALPLALQHRHHAHAPTPRSTSIRRGSPTRKRAGRTRSSRTWRSSSPGSWTGSRSTATRKQRLQPPDAPAAHVRGPGGTASPSPRSPWTAAARRGHPAVPALRRPPYKLGVSPQQAQLAADANYNRIQFGGTAMKMEGPWFLPQMWGPLARREGGTQYDRVRCPPADPARSST